MTDFDHHTIYCFEGCCGGCEDCYGYSLNCHQVPCRCDLPCTCTSEGGETIRKGCERHDNAADTRFLDRFGPSIDEIPSADDLLDIATPCPTCGAVGACAWDDNGAPLIHTSEADQ